MKLREKYLTPEKAKDDYATTVNRVSSSGIDVSTGSTSEHQQEYDNEVQVFKHTYYHCNLYNR